MATPGTGTWTVQYRNGQRQVFSFYYSDAAGPCRFQKDGIATVVSPDLFYNTIPCVLIDICFPAQPATITYLVIKINDNPASVLLAANYLAANYNRISPNLPLGVGHKLTFVQA